MYQQAKVESASAEGYQRGNAGFARGSIKQEHAEAAENAGT